MRRARCRRGLARPFLVFSPRRLRAALDRDIAEIDAAMSEQLDAVLHARDFSTSRDAGAALPG